MACAVIFLSFWSEVHYNSIYPEGGKKKYIFVTWTLILYTCFYSRNYTNEMVIFLIDLQCVNFYFLSNVFPKSLYIWHGFFKYNITFSWLLEVYFLWWLKCSHPILIIAFFFSFVLQKTFPLQARRRRKSGGTLQFSLVRNDCSELHPWRN